MSDYIYGSLKRSHDRTQFDCGVPVLNEYFRRFATQDLKRKAAAVFVACHRDEPERVVGFYTLCSTSVQLTQLPQELVEKLPRYPDVPAVLIGRLARDPSHPGVGGLLLADALERCVRVSKEIAATLILVDSKGPSATRFYAKYGFMSLPGLPDRMFLPMKTAEKL